MSRIFILSALSWVLLKGIGYLIPSITFLSSYTDDFFIIPFVMGFALCIQQKFIAPEFTFKIFSIVLVWLYFSIVFEGIIPFFTKNYTRDYLDIIAYAAGALYFLILLNKQAKHHSVKLSGNTKDLIST